MHLIEETRFYIHEIQTCLTSSENASKTMTVAAVELFQANSFPNILLKGPAGERGISQPVSHLLLQEDIHLLKEQINTIGQQLLQNRNCGKTKHPGYHYFNAAEWFQYAEMHFRHHLMQKEKLDIYLKYTS